MSKNIKINIKNGTQRKYTNTNYKTFAQWISQFQAVSRRQVVLRNQTFRVSIDFEPVIELKISKKLLETKRSSQITPKMGIAANNFLISASIAPNKLFYWLIFRYWNRILFSDNVWIPSSCKNRIFVFFLLLLLELLELTIFLRKKK